MALPAHDNPATPPLLSIPAGQSVCLAKPEAGNILQKGDHGFDAYLDQIYKAPEIRALDQVTALKARLRTSVHFDHFWRVALTGLSEILDTQMVWISRRMKVEPEDPNVELPEIGEDGSAVHCVAWYYTNNKDDSGFGRNLRSESRTSPSAYMRFNKPFLLPSGLKQFAPDYLYMSRMPIDCDSYLGLPLFSDGECIGHIGATYTPEGLQRRKLSWGWIHMILHAFEDMFADRIIAETEPLQIQPAAAGDAPTQHDASPTLLPSQGFKPYAQSLSHELRTPMQGVVGMLDVMQTSLIEATESTSPKAEQILKKLQEDIEVTQDSCRRAVEAADNVVQAYDLNMGMPLPAASSSAQSHTASPTGQSATVSQRQRRDPTKSRKRSRDLEVLRKKPRAPLSKFEYSLTAYSERQEGLQQAVQDAEDLTAANGMVSSRGREEAQQAWQEKNSSPVLCLDSNVHDVHLPDLLEWVINESLKIGGRPKSIEAYDTENGQVIEAVFVQNSGHLMKKVIQWRVEDTVPDLIKVHERNLAKIISCVFQNALKFTREGRIYVHARGYEGELNIIVSDSGSGISPEFQLHLFEPFAREDFSITRGNEGLGLGLLVAKSLANRLGGDVSLTRSEKSGPLRGSDFEIVVPMVAVSSAATSRRPSSTTLSVGLPDGSHSTKRKASSAGLPEPPAKLRKLSTELEITSTAVTPITPTSPWLRSRQGSLRTIAEDGDHGAAAFSSPSQLPVLKQPHAVTEAPTHAVTPSRRSPPPSDDVRTLNRKLADDYPLRILVAEDQPLNRKLLVKMLTKLGYDPETQIVEAYDGADALRRVVGSRRGSAAASTPMNGSMSKPQENTHFDLVLMDLWMPIMDGYEATERILGLYKQPLRPGQRRSITEPSNVPAAVVLAGDLPVKLAVAEKVRRGSQQSEVALSSGAETPVGAPDGRVADSSDGGDDVPPIIMAVTADTTDGAAERAMKAGMYGCMLKPFKLKELERLMVQSWQRRMHLTTK